MDCKNESFGKLIMTQRIIKSNPKQRLKIIFNRGQQNNSKKALGFFSV